MKGSKKFETKKVNETKTKKIIKEEKIIDKIEVGINFDFNKYNTYYSWGKEDYIIEFTKKRN